MGGSREQNQNRPETQIPMSFKLQRTVLVDCHGIGHFVKHSMASLRSGSDDTGTIFGFLACIKEAAQRIKPGQFVFAWDSSKSLRKRLYAGYKGTRDKAREERTFEEEQADAMMMSQLNLLREEILPGLGFQNSFQSAGREADDIIASCCISLPGKKFIMSRDQDLLQLITPDTCMWDFQKKSFFNDDDFRAKWLCEPHEWKMVKAISGCTTDDVPNVPGVKEATAVKYLHGTLPHHHKTYQAIAANKELIERNKPLVILPFAGTPKYVVKPDAVQIAAFWELCERYEFNSYLQKIEEWVEAFRMR